MATRWHRLVFVLAALMCACPAAEVDAQQTTVIPERAYVTGGVFVGVKRFSGDPTDGALDGNATGGALAVGTFIGSRWDLQLGLDVGSFSETERSRTVTLQKETFTLTSVTENQLLSVATLLRFRASPHGRVRLGYLGGLSFIRLHRKYRTFADADTPAGLVPRPDERVDFSAAPTVGLDARIAVAHRLSIMPGIHACVFRFADESGFVVRPRIAVRWEF